MTIDYIVDAHHHLWDLDACRHTWLSEKGVKRFFGDPTPIQKNYHAKNFKAEFGSLPVRKSVHIQCGVATEESIKETFWADAEAEAATLPNAIVAFAELTSLALEDELNAHEASTRLRGIRQIVGRSAEEDRKTGTSALLQDERFNDGLRTLAGRKLSFDLQLTPPLMEEAADVFGKVEELPIALCHCGSPSDFSDKGIAEWAKGLERLAELPNLICKISGFGMFDHDWTVDSIRPHVLRVIDIFGPERVAFGSNFPVDKLHATYESVMGAYLEITSGFSADERFSMFAGTAEKFYRI
ncbi:MAG: amidohydrolase family protein [Pseudomonadota bacterium]